MQRGSQLRKEETNYDAHVECRDRTLRFREREEARCLGLGGNVVAALAIVPNGLGSDASLTAGRPIPAEFGNDSSKLF